MKLRNKSTGEIEDILISAYGISGDVALSRRNESFTDGYEDLARYKTLAELNEEWEDYTPKEPLIKDEKIRKAIRTWSEINAITEVNVVIPTYDCSILSLNFGMLSIEFIDDKEDLIDGATYTITELCGEEEC